MDRCLNGSTVTALFDGYNYVLHHRNYYLPFPDARDREFIKRSNLASIHVDEEACFAFHGNNVSPYDREFRTLSHRATESPDDYHLLNGSFMGIDANMYYGLIRKFAPRRIIEIGSGNSTKLASHAISRNVAEGRVATELICIEPFHGHGLGKLERVSRVIESYVQEVDLDLFEELGPNDILFIDSTHTVRPGGDVWWEICEILPRLKSGVLVHLHDISLPNPYPAQYLRNHWYWMEQYFLQAFLAFNDRFAIVWPGNPLMLSHRQRMMDLFAPEFAATLSEFPRAEPSSFWMRVN